MNGGDPGSGAAACSSILTIFVTGGPLANTIDLSGVTQSSFPNIGTGIFAIGEPIVISGAGGADTITGSGFPDRIFGGAGDDTITGGGGLDLLFFLGTSGADTITATDPSGTITNGTETDTYSQIERFGLSGGLGNDTLTGASGDDELFGEDGSDTLNGGLGIDRMFFDGTAANETLITTPPAGTLTAGGQTDTYSSVEEFLISGGEGNDTISSGSGDDELYGGPGNDVLSGGGGDDGLFGDTPTDLPPNDDTLDGGPGDDFLVPSQGSDAVRGGTGADLVEEDLFGVENDNWDGQEGSDRFSIAFGSGAQGKTMILADSGSGADTDSLEVADCTGVTVTSTEARRGAEVISYSGIEERPCGFTPPPPPLPPPPTPPPAAPPPPPPPPPPVVIQPPPVVRCVVPNVKGKTVVNAKAALKARRCAVGKAKQTFSEKVKKGRVIAQSKRPGTRHPRNTKVNLTVSKGARKK